MLAGAAETAAAEARAAAAMNFMISIEDKVSARD